MSDPILNNLVQPDFRNGRFYCPWLGFSDVSLFQRIKYYLTHWDSVNETKELEDTVFYASPEKRPVRSKELIVTWISHSYLLVQMDNLNILTDPIVSDIVLSRYIFPPRVNQNAISTPDLPEIDYVLISHSHHDHLDYPAITQLHQRFPKIKFLVPLNVKALILSVCAAQVEEFGWWDQVQLSNQVTAAFVPAQHGSRRSLFDENKTLWGGWCLVGTSDVGTFYYSGDTGYYQPIFKTIGMKYGPFDVAALAIGAYAPKFLFKYQHADPRECILIQQDVQAKHCIGVHWGTFRLGYEGVFEPRHVLDKEKESFELGDATFKCIRAGCWHLS